MATKEFVEETINNYTIAVFAKSYCPYCRRTRDLIGKLDLDEGQTVKIHDIDLMDNGSQIQDYLLEKTGQRTVPNIFINKKHLGGNDDIQAAYKSGKLAKLIANAA